MDYEKKYKEALERARKCWGEYNEIVGAYENKGVCEEIFPELKESEDEKIRKALLNYIYDVHDDDEERARWIAWLEKVGKIVDYYEDRLDECACKYFNKGYKHALEKQGEQKPVPKFKIGDTMRTLQEAKNGFTDGMPVVVSIDEEYYHCTNELIAIKDQDKYEYPPMNRRQKPAWSEEDEKYANIVVSALSSPSLKRLYHFNKVSSNDMINWFESLKDRVQPQPKQEWSEEDNRRLNKIEIILRHSISSSSEDISWLKSLRPQKQWKPSEEQMKAFKYCIDNNCCDKDGVNGSKMVELYKQLKAL